MHIFSSWVARALAGSCVVGLCLGSFANTASADLIYDNRPNATDGGTLTTTGSTPRNYMADSMNTLAPPTASQVWEVQTIGWQLFVVGSGQAGVPVTYENVTARFRVYDTWDSAAPAGTSVFSGLVSDVIWNLGNITNNSSGGGALAFTYNLNYASNNLAFELGDGQGMGIAIEILQNGTKNQNLASIIRGGGFDPIIGTSTNGWYRDANDNGIIEAGDFRTLGSPNSPSHLSLQIDAIAIPEPAMAGLGVAGVLLLMRRRRA